MINLRQDNMNREEKIREILSACSWLLSAEEIQSMENSLQETPPVSIRFNPFKESNSRQGNPVPWCTNGIYLDQRPSFTLDPFLHAGSYYVQEASSMFLDHILRQLLPEREKWRVLDLCAAPGGKSTLTSALLPNGSLLVSNEIIANRASVLRENIQKWGIPNTIVTSLDPVVIGEKVADFFDMIIIDAPCSGEGLIRKDHGALDEWSVGNVHKCDVRQKKILSDIWSSLKPGGILIYSTCTYNKSENEDQLEFLATEMRARNIEIDVPSEWNIVQTTTSELTGFRFFPHRIKGEGFFVSVIRKPEGHFRELHINNKLPLLERASVKDKSPMIDLLDDNYSAIITKKENDYYFIHEDLFNDVQVLSQRIPLLHQGNPLATVKGKDVIPDPALALSLALNRKKYPGINLDLRNALLFLKKEQITCDANDGWNLISYKDRPLGWLKQMGNRSNNYYPKEWKIRMQLPEVL
jgi:16S rRNA C967 or C1407 C5-methylase (RsmB/RsmF family)/NOL1/NOP2/fmu family ribosome biogenesis protein